jgi:hypothetical protein
MKATLRFDLPDEKYQFESATNGQKYRYLLIELWNEFREKDKYAEKQETTWEEARELLMDTFTENNIYYDDL